VVIVVCVMARGAGAHALEPSSLQIEERAPGVASARFQAPTAAALTPRWPAGCVGASNGRESEGATTIERFEIECGRGLAGMVIGVDGLAARDTIAIVRVRLADGRVAREILGPTRPSFRIPEGTSWVRTAVTYGWLGVEHLMGGLDHLLFVLGLLLVVPGLRARAITLTAFTAGHSLTLALAVLGVVRVPQAPIEVLIAVTLLFVACEALAERPRPRRTWVVAAVFGLAHGFGFAGALAGAGLPAGELPLALAAFNLGIELGQLAFAGAIIVMVGLARRATRLAPHARTATAYAIGAMAAMWCLERTWAALLA
jgi:hypothetical protein